MLGLDRITPGLRQILWLVLLGWLFQWFGPLLVAGEWLADVPQAVLKGHIWRLLTYPLAGDLTPGTLLTALFFLPFASSVERSLGTIRFRRLFWGSTLVAGIVLQLVNLMTPAPALTGLLVPTLAVGTAFCLLNWRETIYLMLIIPVKVPIALAFGLAGVLLSPMALWPVLYSPALLATLMIKHNWLMQMEAFSKPASGRRRSRLGHDYKGPKVTPIRPNFRAPEVSEAEARVDQILDKLRHEGMASLTADEKEVLDSHSKRLRHGDERM
ncbi:hypothetical protein JST97_28675 [bacterium]|nr:hypothetical protein [bacterium]